MAPTVLGTLTGVVVLVFSVVCWRVTLGSETGFSGSGTSLSDLYILSIFNLSFSVTSLSFSSLSRLSRSLCLCRSSLRIGCCGGRTARRALPLLL